MAPCSQDRVTPSCGRWLPVTPTLGAVTQVRISLSEEGSWPGPGEGCLGAAHMERGGSKGTCLWEAGLDPSRCSIQACVSKLGRPTVDPHRAEVGQVRGCSRSSGSHASWLPIPATWGASKHPDAQTLPRICAGGGEGTALGIF